jgi:hypothetical protein
MFKTIYIILHHMRNIISRMNINSFGSALRVSARNPAQGKTEGAALANLAFHPDGAMMGFDNVLGNAQPQTDTILVFSDRWRSIKFIE